MKRLLWLGLGALSVAVLLGLALRFQTTTPSRDLATPALLPRFEIVIELGGGGLTPYRVQVPKDHEVHLVVQCGPGAPEGMLVLLGYEDMVRPVDVGPGQGREIVFTSTRPGDDFGLSLGGRLVGRLEVTGGHLEEGHR